jgi:adenosylcobinamide-phosphate synthase
MDRSFLIHTIPLIIGYVLDLLLGDPRWLPHPVRLFGTVIYKSEVFLNKGKFKLIKGAALVILLCCAVFFFFYFAQKLVATFNMLACLIFTGIFIFYGLANKSLLQEGEEVFNELSKGLVEGRKRLSWIVGRDTTNLSENQIKIAVMETLSENLSDGVVAPLFYYAVGGLPAMMTYKMINTLDSMIAYKSERYQLFGKFAARLDDAANFIPARITAFLMIMVTFSKNGLLFIIKFANKHASPNAGFPEAALAGILNCQFGGPAIYHGKIMNKYFIGSNNRVITLQDLSKVIYINHSVTLLMVIGCILIRLLIQ